MKPSVLFAFQKSSSLQQQINTISAYSAGTRLDIPKVESAMLMQAEDNALKWVCRMP